VALFFPENFSNGLGMMNLNRIVMKMRKPSPSSIVMLN
jgi:hypothetical protein